LSALVDQVVDDLIKDSHSVINIKNKWMVLVFK
jgi:hypothetical protein